VHGRLGKAVGAEKARERRAEDQEGKDGEQGPSEQELAEAKSYINGSQMLSLDTSAKLAQALLQYQNDGLPIDYIDKRSEVVNAVTLADAKRVAQRLWSNGLLTVVVGRQPQAAAQPAVKPAGTPPAPRAN
jgi:zinc protease